MLSFVSFEPFLEDFYAKEIALLIDGATPGTNLAIDVTELAGVAVKNGKPVRDMINIDNVNNKITVSTRLNTGTSFVFFNDVDVVYKPVELPSGSSQTSQFIFEVKARQRE